MILKIRVMAAKLKCLANKSVYSFENRCIENSSIQLGDGVKKIFLNAKGDRTGLSKKLISFLDYIKTGKATDELTNKIDLSVSEAKSHEQWREEYHMFASLVYLDAVAESKAEGRAEEKPAPAERAAAGLRRDPAGRDRDGLCPARRQGAEGGGARQGRAALAAGGLSGAGQGLRRRRLGMAGAGIWSGAERQAQHLQLSASCVL